MAESSRLSTRGTLPGSLASRCLCDVARPRAISLLDSQHVSGPAAARGIPRTSGSIGSSTVSKARAPGDHSQSTLELGHHQTPGTGQVDLLLSLRDPGCF